MRERPRAVRLLTLTAAALALLSTGPILGEEGVAAPDWSFKGGFQIGLRSVEVEGREEKYREDYNLEDGPRLFNFNFELVPTVELRRYFDRLALDLSNLGGDPFETIRLSIEKSGRYQFEYDKRKSAYFYEDQIAASGGDHHTYDFDRERDAASIQVRLSPAAQVSLGFDRCTKRGRSVTTQDIERDEFELEAPVDESLSEYRGAFEYAWKRATLVLEETVRDYENVDQVFLRGRSLGMALEDETSLDFFFLDQPYSSTSREHALRLVARPNDRLLLRLGGALHDVDLDLDVSERGQGVDFRGVPFARDRSGAGAAERDVELFDFELSYRLGDRAALLAGAKSRTLDQHADLIFEGGPSFGHWAIETTSIQIGLQYAISTELSLSGGFVREARDVGLRWATGAETEADREETRHSGHFLTVGWRPSRVFRLTGEYQDSSYDDPFSLASPTDRKRYRLRAQYGVGEGVSLSGSFRRNDLENSSSGWRADHDQLQARLGYRRGSFAGSLGYSRLDSARQIDQIVVTEWAAELPFLIFYEIDSSYLDGRLLWSFRRGWRLGGDVRLYRNDGNFAMDREIVYAWVEAELMGDYVAHVGYRRIDYDEARHNLDDFAANILEMSVGYRW